MDAWRVDVADEEATIDMLSTVYQLGYRSAVLVGGGVGVPPEGIGLILGVDRFLDMCRTTLNVVGDLVAATVISALSSPSPAEPPAASA